MRTTFAGSHPCFAELQAKMARSYVPGLSLRTVSGTNVIVDSSRDPCGLVAASVPQLARSKGGQAVMVSQVDRVEVTIKPGPRAQLCTDNP